MDKEKKIIEIRKVLLKHTNEVDNWNDAIFEQDFDELVDDLFALHVVGSRRELLIDQLESLDHNNMIDLNNCKFDKVADDLIKKVN